MEKLLKIGITQGDINGIGYEVILKTLADPRMLELCIPVIYGSSKAIGYYKKLLELDHLSINIVKSANEAGAKRINIINCGADELKVEMGQCTAEGGQGAFAALEAATAELQTGHIDALVTAPINKSNMPNDNFKFPGHTEYLEHKANGQKSLMILMSGNTRIALVTNHIAISEISKTITEELILNKLAILNQTLIRDFGIVKPRIAVFGLNPHAGDQGLFGDEEARIITPALKKANEKGILCVGPLSADGFWGSRSFQHYDAILAMYHDQALGAFKALYMDEGVNFTAGLPFVRTSPAHGTAYDLVGKNEASEQSFRQAMYSACDIIRYRAMYDEMSKNPLVVEPIRISNKKND